MEQSWKEKARYRYEQFLGKGGSSIFISLFIIFIVGLIVMVLVRQFAAAVGTFPAESQGEVPNSDGFWGDFWRTLKEMIDPGNIGFGDGNALPSVLLTMISILFGVVIFSMLIAFITTAIDNTLNEFRKGRSKVFEQGFTLILGWNERVVDIIKELTIANESLKEASIVILADQEKEMMDDLLQSKIEDFKTTKVITTPGYPASLSELKRIQAGNAKSVIILASCTESAPQEEKDRSDNQAIKNIMALNATQGNKNQLPIIVEVYGEDKREAVKFFNDPNIVTIDSWNIMGKLMVQTSLTSGLEMVYHEMFGFDGSEMYFYEGNFAGKRFDDLVYHFEDGIPVGIYREEEDRVILRPESGVNMLPGDQLIILSSDDSAIKYNASPIVKPQSLELSGEYLEKQSKRILMLGWHDISRIFIKESNDYLKEGSDFDIMFSEPTEEISAEITALQAEYPNLQINLIEGNPRMLGALEAVKPFNYDTILILSQDAGEQEPEKVDSDTMMILLLLRKIKSDLGIRPTTKILTQILNSENQELIQQTDVDDFIISNKLITMILAQLSEQPKLQMIYDDLFKEDGSEIYVKPAHLYLKEAGQTVNFADLIALAQKRNEICIGVRIGAESQNASKHFGISLNPSKKESYKITENDFLIVIAENEL